MKIGAKVTHINACKMLEELEKFRNKLTITGNIPSGYCVSFKTLSEDDLKELLSLFGYSDIEQAEKVEEYVEDPSLREKLNEIIEHIYEKRALNAVKLLKEVTGLGLKDAKDVVDTIRSRNESLLGTTPFGPVPEQPLVADTLSIIAKCLPFLSEEGRTAIMKGFSKAELYKYRGTIHGASYGI